MSDHVEQLAQRLQALDGEPLGRHPDVLDEVHRGLVGELERLAGAVAGDPGTPGTGTPHHRD